MKQMEDYLAGGRRFAKLDARTKERMMDDLAAELRLRLTALVKPTRLSEREW
jgi:hypothetical protein